MEPRWKAYQNQQEDGIDRTHGVMERYQPRGAAVGNNTEEWGGLPVPMVPEGTSGALPLGFAVG